MLFFLLRSSVWSSLSPFIRCISASSISGLSNIWQIMLYNASFKVIHIMCYPLHSSSVPLVAFVYCCFKLELADVPIFLPWGWLLCHLLINSASIDALNSSPSLDQWSASSERQSFYSSGRSICDGSWLKEEYYSYIDWGARRRMLLLLDDAARDLA